MITQKPWVTVYWSDVSSVHTKSICFIPWPRFLLRRIFSSLSCLGVLVTRSALRHLRLLFLQHKVLLQQFNTGDERAQKRQPIRGSDEGEQCLVGNVYSQADICPWISSPQNHHYHKKNALLLALGCAPWAPDKLCSWSLVPRRN